ncbi:hypothetical protein EGR_10058 [Echinococcus granulosus]|uniref:Uncharacterized protein n=1 Tax=Echinococcus granulosus TaxID=6210 RepID=W6U3F5_ECHGR|nr:hypothetical protein EGR_10058 [Echinococcus granulosus]EUB55091.1 hypothetical protein EGR_10058 [Echinococcus granulosus]
MFSQQQLIGSFFKNAAGFLFVATATVLNESADKNITLWCRSSKLPACMHMRYQLRHVTQVNYLMNEMSVLSAHSLQAKASLHIFNLVSSKSLHT